MEQKERFDKSKLLKLLESSYFDDDIRIDAKNLIEKSDEASLKELFQILDKYIYECKVKDEDLRVALEQEKNLLEEQALAKAEELSADLALFEARISEEEKPARIREVHQKILS